MARQQFSDVEVVRYEDVLEVNDPINLLAYVTSLPAGELPDASARLADAVQESFAGSKSVFRISKAVELLLCRGT